MRRSHAINFSIYIIHSMLLSEVASFVWLDMCSSNEDVQTHLEVYVA